MQVDNSPSDFSDTSSLHSVTPSIAEALFRSPQGNATRFQTLTDHYIWPFDDFTPQYERLSLEFKLLVTGGFLPGGDEGVVAQSLRASGNSARVLDVGCGIRGLWLQGMGSLFTNAECTGLDLVPVQIERTPPNVFFEIWDVAQGLPFRDNHFDVIRASSFAIFFPKYTFFLHEALRCLKPGGHLLLAEPDSRLHIGDHLIDWISLQCTTPTSHPSLDHHDFDDLAKTLQTARSFRPTSGLPRGRFARIEEKLWLTPVGLNADVRSRSRLVRRLSALNTQILLFFFRSKLLDPEDNSERSPTQTNATFAWLERIMSVVERVEGGLPILNPFKTVCARKAVEGEEECEMVVQEEAEEVVMKGISGLGVGTDADDELSDF